MKDEKIIELFFARDERALAEVEKKYEIANLGIIPNFYLSRKSSYNKYGYQKGAGSNYES